jgi:hypothetical protein
MPAMLRPNNKARKIVFDILGTPPTIKSDKRRNTPKKRQESNDVRSGQPLLIPRLNG